MMIVASALETKTRRRGRTEALVLRVEDPVALAARCWNAGYTVLVEECADAFGSPVLSVIDRLGLRINLRAPEPSAR